MSAMSPTSIVSPCMNICVLDGKTGFCIGCFRTQREIADWGRLTPQQKMQLLMELDRRRQAADTGTDREDPAP